MIFIPFVDEISEFTEEQYKYILDRVNKARDRNNISVNPINQKQNKETTMPIIDISAKDALRGVLLPTAWYIVKVDVVGDATPSKDGGSQNYLIEGTLLANAETGDETYKGYPTPYWNFNSKALGFVVGFLRALGEDVKPGRVELKGAEGKLLKVFIEQGEYNGRINNRIEHKYAPVS